MIDACQEGTLALVTANGEADLTTNGGRLYAPVRDLATRVERHLVRVGLPAAQAPARPRGRVARQGGRRVVLGVTLRERAPEHSDLLARSTLAPALRADGRAEEAQAEGLTGQAVMTSADRPTALAG